MSHAASARSTRATPIPSSGSTTTSARQWSRGNTVYLRGQVGQDLDTARVGRDRRRRRPGRAGDGERRAAPRASAARASRTSAGSRSTSPTSATARRSTRCSGRWLKGVLPGVHRRRGHRRSRGPNGWSRSTSSPSSPTSGHDVLAGRALRAHGHGRHGRRLVEPAVAARCAHARAGAGAAASQNVTDPRLGPGRARPPGRRAAAAAGRRRGSRQGAGRGVPPGDGGRRGGVDGAFSGAYTLGTHEVAHGPGAVAAGNLLASPDVPAAMVGGLRSRARSAPGSAAHRGAACRARSGWRGGAGALGRAWSSATGSNGRSSTCASTGTTTRSRASPSCGRSGSRRSATTSRGPSTLPPHRASASRATTASSNHWGSTPNA